MSLSPAAFFGAIDANNPLGTDSRTIADNQFRNILLSLKDQAPNWTAAITSTHGDLNLVSGWVAAGKAPAPRAAGVTVEWFYNLTVPVGYTLKVLDTNLRNLCVASGGATPVNPGTTQGNIDPSAATLDTTIVNVAVDLPANTGGHGLTVDQNGPHTHTESQVGGTGGLQAGTGIGTQTVNTGSSGSGTPHTHPLGGTAAQTPGTGVGSTTAFNPRRAVGILGTLDA